MSTNTKTSARPALKKRASSSSSTDRPYVRRSAVRALLEKEIGHLENDMPLPDTGSGKFAKKYAANVLRGLLHDLEAL
jgi:hypothetical protein